MGKINVISYITYMKLPCAGKTQVIDGLLTHGILRFSDLMKATEEEVVSSIPCIRGKNLAALKCWMDRHDMRFGMSDDEIEDYNTEFWAGLRHRPSQIL